LLTANHIEAIEFKLGRGWYFECCCTNNRWCWWNRKLWLGRNAHAHVHDVGREIRLQIKELNFQKGCRYKTVTLEFEELFFGYLKGENGVHRLVRISPLTIVMPSYLFASVYVYPLVVKLTSILLISRLRLPDQWCGRTKCK
jgi:hypothetical protein